MPPVPTPTANTVVILCGGAAPDARLDMQSVTLVNTDELAECPAVSL
jgi:hypothetical protein